MNAWLNLRELIDLANKETAYKELDELSQKVLEWVCMQHNPKSNLFVQAIVLDSKIASPATIHKCLATLERTGFLNFVVDPEDSRRRIVSPTAKASKTLDALSRRVEKWDRRQRA
jgi:DNA-binding MarR family transcriptional regulator